MKISPKLALAICLSLFTPTLYAAPDVIVQGVKMPAWLQRDGRPFPLTAGMELQDNDQIFTGGNARVLLQTADGSAIKLGENAAFAISNLAQQRESQSIFTALLNVAKGAFRFTTALVDKHKAREVTIKVANATIGVRGTDVWGKSGGKMRMDAMEKAMGKAMNHPGQEMLDFDVVCLIEGKIEMQHLGDAPFMMEQPVTFYVMPKDEAAMPVAPLAMEQLSKWAQETEIAPNSGATSAGGKWKVVLLSAPTESAILGAYDQWRNAGYAVRILPVNGANGREYQLRITQIASQTEADALAKSLTGKFGASSPKVTR